MANPSLALLMPNLSSLSESKRKAFLLEINKTVPEGTLVLLDGKTTKHDDIFRNLKLIAFSHSKDIGDTLRTGLAASMELGAEKTITFENYSLSNAKWFLPYLDIGNVIESKKRGFAEMLVTEITNVLSFCNAYNGFSMNRIFTKEAAAAIKETRLKGKGFLLESVNSLNSRGIKTVEVINRDKKQKSNNMNVNELISSVTKSLNKSSALFSIFSSLAYLVNISAVYLSLSIGAFYPLAVFLGGELSAMSNFIMNEKINFKNRGFLSSAYRLGKFNVLATIPLLFDIIFIGYLAGYTNILGKTLFTDLSVVSIMAVSMVSFIIITKLMWVKGNHVRVPI